MPYRQPGWTKCRAEALMDIAAALSDLTHRQKSAHQIPRYLSQTLAIDNLSMALVKSCAEGNQIAIGRSKWAQIPEEFREAFAQDLLAIHQRTHPPTAGESLGAPAGGPIHRPYEPA